MIRPVNDFRIGNLVLDEDGELCIIEQLSSDKMECFQQVSKIENKSCISTKYPSNIYAIQLTEKWLLKAGYKKQNGYGYSNYNIYGLILKNDTGFEFHYYGIIIRIDFVHQLQNLFFSFYREELVFSSTEP